MVAQKRTVRTTLNIDDDILHATQITPLATTGRFAILPLRDEIITPEHAHKMMEQKSR